MKGFSSVSRLLFVMISFLLLSCQEKEKVTEMDLLFSSLHADQAKWWRYHKTNIDLSSDFLPLGEDGDSISKKAFFEALLTGEFIAIEKKSNAARDQYQLFKLTKESDGDISYTISADSYREYKHFIMEGQQFPDFNLTALDGKSYSKEALQGKTLAIKTWFLNCKPCIEEMPQLNQLVEEYRKNEDVIFLSLSLDTKAELQEFLSERDFKYAVVPLQKAFIEDTLGFSIYPTHIVVEPSGKIRKVVNTAPEMIAALKSMNKE